jgi:phosphate transport system substrate-binding protein
MRTKALIKAGDVRKAVANVTGQPFPTFFAKRHAGCVAPVRQPAIKHGYIGAIFVGFVITAMVSMPADVLADRYRIEALDGSTVVGELVSFQNGRYTLSTAFGQVTIEGGKVRSLARLDAAAPPVNLPPPVPNQPPALPNSAAGALRLHGSNTIGAELAPALIENFVHQSRGTLSAWVTEAPEMRSVTVENGGGALPARFEVHARGTKTAFEDLASGAADIGTASRRISDSELGALSRHGDMTSPEAEHVIGMDGVVVMVHPSNAVRQLTIQQVADIYGGRLRNWRDVGGADIPIKAYTRDDKSGTYDTFKTLVLGTTPMAASAIRLESSEELSDHVASDPGAIGYGGLAYVHNAQPIRIKVCNIEYEPTSFSIKTEEYPISRRLFMYRLPSSSAANLTPFLAFVQSDPGQDIVQHAGFVNLHVENGGAASAASRREYAALWTMSERNLFESDKAAVARMFEAARGATRLSVTFRFEKSRAVVDSRAVQDLSRLSQFLHQPENVSRRVHVIGFASAIGARDYNLKLSNDRAKTVADLLQAQGIQVASTFGVGGNLPVACNDTEQSALVNQRVEIWLQDR